MLEPGWSLAVSGLSVAATAGPLAAGLHVRNAAARELDSLGAALGLEWPGAPNTSAGRGPTVLWLSPVEWLVTGIGPRELAEAAGAAISGLHHVSPVGAGLVQFTLRGERAPALLAKGCSLDLHPRAFGPGRCARSLLAGTPVLIHRPSDEATFDLFVDVSLSAWTGGWMEDAALEWA